MSKYSGQCDFYDTIKILGGFDDINNIKNYNIYVGSNFPLVIYNMKDLMPYYGYGITSGGFDNIHHTGNIFLTNKSLIDIDRESFERYNMDTSGLDNMKKLLENDIKNYKGEEK